METSNSSPFRPANNNPSATSKRPQQPLFIPPGQVAHRLLCHASRVGGLIGKSGSIIKNIQQQTSTKIRVDDPPNAGTDFRVISVIGSPVVGTKIKVSGVSEVVVVEEGEENDGLFDVSAAQDGILRVFERVVEVAVEGDAEAAIGGVVSLRILAGKGQVGAVIGKAGMVVAKIRKDTGCKIKVLISEKLPSGPFPNEEIVEIEGDVLGVKKALLAVTGRLQEFPPPSERTRANLNRPDAESLNVLNIDQTLQHSPVLQPASNNVINSSGNSPSILNTGAKSNTGFTRKQEMVFTILCPGDKIGCVIGKGGSIIKSIQTESGAYINIGPVVAECNERLITIHAMENVESQYSPVQKAAVLVFSRFMEGSPVMSLDSDVRKPPACAKVVVPVNQVGCLLGKGGAIISEMRKATGTGLKIFGGDQLPKCAPENVEILQITGELANVRDAIHRVVGRLRGYIFLTHMSNGGLNRDAFKTENSSYGRNEPPAPVMSPITLSNVNDHDSLTQRMDHLGISNNIDRPLAHTSQASIPVAGAQTGNLMEGGRRLPPNQAGTELGRLAIVTNTRVEITVPDSVIGSVYGENGSNLVRLRQISGAEVMVHEALPGTTDRMVVISGSPDQTQAAQSLLQAFILSGSV